MRPRQQSPLLYQLAKPVCALWLAVTPHTLPEGFPTRQGTASGHPGHPKAHNHPLVKLLTKHSPGAPRPSGRHAMLPSAHVAGCSTTCPRPPRHGLRCPVTLMIHWSPCQLTPQTGTATPLLHPIPGASTTARRPRAHAERKVAAICEGSQSDLLGPEGGLGLSDQFTDRPVPARTPSDGAQGRHRCPPWPGSPPRAAQLPRGCRDGGVSHGAWNPGALGLPPAQSAAHLPSTCPHFRDTFCHKDPAPRPGHTRPQSPPGTWRPLPALRSQLASLRPTCP